MFKKDGKAQQEALELARITESALNREGGFRYVFCWAKIDGTPHACKRVFDFFTRMFDFAVVVDEEVDPTVNACRFFGNPRLFEKTDKPHQVVIPVQLTERELFLSRIWNTDNPSDSLFFASVRDFVESKKGLLNKVRVEVYPATELSHKPWEDQDPYKTQPITFGNYLSAI